MVNGQQRVRRDLVLRARESAAIEKFETVSLQKRRNQIRAVTVEIHHFYPAGFQQLFRAVEDLKLMFLHVDLQNQVAVWNRKRIQFLAGHDGFDGLTGLGHFEDARSDSTLESQLRFFVGNRQVEDRDRCISNRLAESLDGFRIRLDRDESRFRISIRKSTQDRAVESNVRSDVDEDIAGLKKQRKIEQRRDFIAKNNIVGGLSCRAREADLFARIDPESCAEHLNVEIARRNKQPGQPNAHRREPPDRDPEKVTREIASGKTHARGRMTEQGLPAAMTSGGTSLVTTEQAPITLRAPISTPGRTKARAPMNASGPIVILAVTNWSAGCEKSWLPVLR